MSTKACVCDGVRRYLKVLMCGRCVSCTPNKRFGFNVVAVEQIRARKTHLSPSAEEPFIHGIIQRSWFCEERRRNPNPTPKP